MIQIECPEGMVLVVGDTHCDIKFLEREVIPCALSLGISRIIQVGDFGYWPNMPDGVKFLNRLQEVLSFHDMYLDWLDGNHEAHTWLRKIYGNVRERTVMWPHSRITYLPRGSTWQLGNRKFMACGGAFSIDRQYRTALYDWFPEELIDDYDVRVCRAKGKVDVLLTHDAPGGFECQTEHGKAKDCPETDENRQRLFKVFASAAPKLVMHGHWHEHQINILEGPNGPTPIVGLGYNTGASPALAVLWLEDLSLEFIPRHTIPTGFKRVDAHTEVERNGNDVQSNHHL